MASSDLKIVDIKAYPTSFPLAADSNVRLGIGRAVKKDAVVVKVTTAGGLIGWGESHHARAPSTIAKLLETTLKMLVVGEDASNVQGIWQKVYVKQLGSHGMGAGTSMAMSGLDMALWDIRGKAVGWPLYKLLGGTSKPIPAYAGGISLGFQEPAALVEEAKAHLAVGYKALKLRLGDNPKDDLARVAAIRKAFGDDLIILSDANTGYSVADARQVMPGLDANNVAWLEEPFPAHDYRSYAEAKTFGRVPLAAGENHYTRFEFSRLIEEKAVTILQPDLSKTGGITEFMKIAAMASAYKLPVHPHSSMTGLNFAASIHVLASLDHPGYFEGDVSKNNLFRDVMVNTPYKVDANGCVRPLEGPGLGLEVDEDFLVKHPVIEGPSYV
ncbi:MAG TPA: mandelate racemase/muconate lactonizing enzyme family protein [Burkholderiales bacterium]|jgi:L-alanine-DL-glutamate epimerase-like enolase superfamily enzyme|nr:mandelate racemase/muconate lactonizing enzyme family protein [Burkholderiales bacterium]